MNSEQAVVQDDSGEGFAWHQRSETEVLDHLQVDPQDGLGGDAVAARQERFGLNEIAETSRRGPWRILFGQFTDFMILVLIVAAVISGVVGEPQDTIAIVVIVLLNAVIGALQEFRAERAVAALRAMAAPDARVRRDGEVLDVPAVQLVPAWSQSPVQEVVSTVTRPSLRGTPGSTPSRVQSCCNSLREPSM